MIQSPQLTRDEMLALVECYCAAMLGPKAPGLENPALNDAAGTAQEKLQAALLATEE